MSKLSLYDMSNDYLSIMGKLIECPDDEILNEISLFVKDEIISKGVEVAKFIVDLENQASGIWQAEARMKERRISIENKAKNIREYLLINIKKCNLAGISDNFISVKIAKNPAAVHVINESLIPSQFFVAKILTTINKVAIAEVCKTGSHVDGIEFKQSERLSIK